MKDDESKERPVNVRFPADVMADIEQFADEDNRKPGPWVRNEIIQLVKERKGGHGKTATKARHPTAIEEPCRHPINRRIGTGCGVCLKDPVR